MNSIKFQHHYVTSGSVKVKVSYHLDNRIDDRKCVTIYSDSYARTLSEILSAHVEVNNGTDTMTDYFEKDRATIFEGHPLYASLRARAEDVCAKNRERWHRNHVRRVARRAAQWIAMRPEQKDAIIEQEARRSDVTVEELTAYLAAQ